LRLRYEITRQLAPYIGVVWTRRFGDTAFFAREDQAPIFDRQWVIGIRIWF
jgi:copper resistance protein B